MGGGVSRSFSAAVTGVTLAAGLVFGGSAAAADFNGLWVLDEKASRDVPQPQKGVALRVALKGKSISVQREFDGARLGEAMVLSLDGVPQDRELGDLGRGTVEAAWTAPGKAYRQVVKAKKAIIPIVQTTLVTLSDDGRTMTRVQVTQQGADETERVLVYRRKE